MNHILVKFSFICLGEELFKEDMSAIEKAAGEGMVLLWNKNGALPLSSTEKNVSLFAYGSYAFVEGGTGSGYIITESLDGKNASVSMKDAFSNKGFSVNENLWNLYKNYSSSRTNPKTDTPEWQQWKVDELPWSKYTSSVTGSFSSYGDVAFITISSSFVYGSMPLIIILYFALTSVPMS